MNLRAFTSEGVSCKVAVGSQGPVLCDTVVADDSCSVSVRAKMDDFAWRPN